MPGHWTHTFSFATGAVRFHDLTYVAMSGDELDREKISHAYFSEWDAGTWRDLGKTSWPIAGMAIARKPMQQMCAVGLYGQVKLAGSGDLHEEQIGTSPDAIRARGPLRGVRTIGEHVYAVGMNRQVWRRDDAHQWRSIDEGARPATDSHAVVGFEAVDGFSETDIYAVGWDGEIWHYDGSAWQQKPSPTNIVLTRVLCADDGTVYASGRKGLLLGGRGDSWEVIDHASMIDDIWDLAWYQDKLYLSTMYGLFTLDQDKLLAVDFGEDLPDSCYRLSASDGVLWSIGSKDIMAFDGDSWARID
ncbi:WD40/YVTN/BNR-like repeat-containing protein [Marilutibacter alkalisoli]|uniref:Exo-alpha-sialidase n=1 Tax=Marilutibacter alkalisoli TaxID=2591633 RepID=A0A514BQA8_9GAMM|nr:hypothetical protein [Lysobacter alkalisoli]QDH69209.1 hypothetical protein FKV23_03180 [Lysobacter alkalisoli]